MCDGAEAIGAGIEVGESSEGGIDLFFGFGAAGMQAQEFWVGIFAAVGVFVCGFAELLGGGRDVEEVVDDLERQAQMGAVVGEGEELWSGSTGGDGANLQAAVSSARS